MQLRDYLNSLPVEDQHVFAERSGTTLGYLRKAISAGSKFETALAVKIEQASGAAVTCEEMRQDLRWTRIADKKWPHSKGRPLVDHAAASQKKAA